MTIEDMIPDPPKFLIHPVTKFIYGIFYFGNAVFLWQTQSLTNYLIEINYSPLIGLMFMGINMMIGFYYLSVYYEDFLKFIRRKK